MNNVYEAVIGIEIHCELKTNTKMFSGAPSDFKAKPNSAINEIDLGMPGALPQVNKEAVRLGVKLAKALNCDVDEILRFDRKNYFYSDLPKGYQITQQFHPLGQNGTFDIYINEDIKTVGIQRLHLEEDTARQFHHESKTLIDFNRAGTPLIEIVTEPDFKNGQEAASFVEAIQLLVIYLGVSDGKMAEGSLRCDLNISLRPKNQKEFGTKVEIKNLNSIQNVQKAIDFEIIRQEKLLNNQVEIQGETRRFDEQSQETISMRIKDENVDYRYLTDANIPPTQISNEILNEKEDETPMKRHQRYMSEYHMSHYDAMVLIKNKEVSDYFEILNKESKETKLIVNYLTQDLLSKLDQKGNQSLETWISPQYFINFIDAVSKKEISTRQAKEVFDEMLKGKDPKKIIKDAGLVQISDEETIKAWILEILENNPRAIEDHRNGLPSAQKFVTGQVMRLSKGQANPQFTNKLVRELLDKAI